MKQIVIGLLLSLALSIGYAQQTKKEHIFHGKVEKVDATAKTLTVNGQNVEGWMGAMTMLYKVDNDDVLSKLKTGDQIEAKVYDGDFTTLHNVQKLPASDQK